ncbi:MAG: DUF1127 domain-containing protein [Roseovarius sp.]
MSTLSRRHHAPFRQSRRASLFDMLELRRQRRALARLDDHALADIGLTREEAEAEARRPVWDIFRR